MPSGRDSFRRNRVAPIGYCATCYDSLHLYCITRAKCPSERELAAVDLAATGAHLLRRFLANATRDYQSFAGDP